MYWGQHRLKVLQLIHYVFVNQITQMFRTFQTFHYCCHRNWMRLSHLTLKPKIGFFLPPPDNRWVWNIDGMKVDMVNCPSATLFTIHPRWTTLGLNLHLHDDEPVTYHSSNGRPFIEIRWCFELQINWSLNYLQEKVYKVVSTCLWIYNCIIADIELMRFLL